MFEKNIILFSVKLFTKYQCQNNNVFALITFYSFLPYGRTKFGWFEIPTKLKDGEMSKFNWGVTFICKYCSLETILIKALFEFL